MDSTPRRLVLVLLGALTLGFSACGSGQANLARRNALQGQLDGYVIERPLAEVMEKVPLVDAPHDEVFWTGSSFTWQDAGPGKMKTTRRSQREDHGDDQHIQVSWFECEAKEVGQGTQVRFFQVTVTSSARGPHETHRERRVDLELDLVGRFDPTAAKKIEAAGDRAAP